MINNVASTIPGSKNDTEALIKVYEKMKFQVHYYEDCDDAVSVLSYTLSGRPLTLRVGTQRGQRLGHGLRLY